VSSEKVPLARRIKATKEKRRAIVPVRTERSRLFRLIKNIRCRNAGSKEFSGLTLKYGVASYGALALNPANALFDPSSTRR
jgi:hypothetical protein